MQKHIFGTIAVCGLLACAAPALAQTPAAARPQSATDAPTPTGPQAVLPPGYVIGLEDVIGVLFWRDETMSGDFIVRPDGRISVPLLNDIEVVGLTPEQLRTKLLDLAKKFVEEPNVTVVVRTINSRKVFITGYVARPSSYPLTAPTTVLQLIALAGGLTEYANRQEITIIRPGHKEPFIFNYDEIRKGRNLQQNIELRAGDTVIVSD
jgi:polysaccharide biosynthesis/export protein